MQTLLTGFVDTTVFFFLVAPWRTLDQLWMNWSPIRSCFWDQAAYLFCTLVATVPLDTSWVYIKGLKAAAFLGGTYLALDPKGKEKAQKEIAVPTLFMELKENLEALKPKPKEQDGPWKLSFVCLWSRHWKSKFSGGFWWEKLVLELGPTLFGIAEWFSCCSGIEGEAERNPWYDGKPFGLHAQTSCWSFRGPLQGASMHLVCEMNVEVGSRTLKHISRVWVPPKLQKNCTLADPSRTTFEAKVGWMHFGIWLAYQDDAEIVPRNGTLKMMMNSTEKKVLDLLFSKDSFEALFKAMARVKKADTDNVYRTFVEAWGVKFGSCFFL